ncbi:hypothetical protein AOB46_06365 [Chryseobacterium indologenes]|uniref:Uncharacterized protein n=1 Tax=Chryseobacterium indologenes TaxID=253 RepID=A0A0N0ZXI4_CHRID|nr:hypothetical protein AOB46_06365 [Chryseobacterium indologenes]
MLFLLTDGIFILSDADFVFSSLLSIPAKSAETMIIKAFSFCFQFSFCQYGTTAPYEISIHKSLLQGSMMGI